MELMEGDTIVVGSDGLFDNVFDHEIVSTMATYSDVAEAGTHFLAFFLCTEIYGSFYSFLIKDLVSMLAKALADLAYNHSVDTKFDSPYSIEARSRVKLDS